MVIKYVLKIGGSLLFGDSLDINKQKVIEFIEFIKKYKKYIDCVVVGGGKIARLYIGAVSTLEPNQAKGDLFGIKVSRLNAFALATLAGENVAYQGVPESIEALLTIKSMVPDKIVFLGGLEVGQSTTSVACEVTEARGLNTLVIGTDVDGMYDKDPDKHPDAKKLEEVTPAEVISILGLDRATNQLAGEYRILDNVSLGVISRSNLQVHIMKGTVESFAKAFEGQKIGTLVKIKT